VLALACRLSASKFGLRGFRGAALRLRPTHGVSVVVPGAVADPVGEHSSRSTASRDGTHTVSRWWVASAATRVHGNKRGDKILAGVAKKAVNGSKHSGGTTPPPRAACVTTPPSGRVVALPRAGERRSRGVRPGRSGRHRTALLYGHLKFQRTPSSRTGGPARNRLQDPQWQAATIASGQSWACRRFARIFVGCRTWAVRTSRPTRVRCATRHDLDQCSLPPIRYR